VPDGKTPLPRHFLATVAVASLLLGVVACTPDLHDRPGVDDSSAPPAVAPVVPGR